MQRLQVIPMDNAKQLVYMFAEFNPSWMLGGWHVYFAPIENGLPNRASNDSVWIGRYDLLLERVCAVLGIAAREN